MFERYPGTVAATKLVGVLGGLVAFVLVAGYLLTGSPTAGIGALVGVSGFFIVMYVLYRLVGYFWYGRTVA